jgi:hypothetical protein
MGCVRSTDIAFFVLRLPPEYGVAADAVEFPSLMEEAPVFEEEGEGEEARLRGPGAAVVSSENWSTRTNDMLDILKKQFERKVSMMAMHLFLFMVMLDLSL